MEASSGMPILVLRQTKLIVNILLLRITCTLEIMLCRQWLHHATSTEEVEYMTLSPSSKKYNTSNEIKYIKQFIKEIGFKEKIPL